jgi:lysophospholipase L1-like esterase
MKLPLLFFVRFALAAFLAPGLGAASESAPASSPLTIALVGDSTMCNYPSDSDTRGWGQQLPQLLTRATKVLNVAKGGASTKTFPAERWRQVIDARADFVFIQFGHNDSHAKEKPESTDAATTFRDNLRRYIGEAREAGITPVLVTPVRRRLFRSNGKLSEELRPYAEAVLIVAGETNTPVVDLHSLSGEVYQRLGEEGSTDFTLNRRDNADRPGLGDRTHFTAEGARRIAELVVADFPRVDPRLAGAVAH